MLDLAKRVPIGKFRTGKPINEARMNTLWKWSLLAAETRKAPHRPVRAFGAKKVFEYVRGHPKVQLRPIKIMPKGGGTCPENKKTEICHEVGILYRKYGKIIKNSYFWQF